MSIRLARQEELPGLRRIEDASGLPFTAIGMTAVAEYDPPPLEVFLGHQRNGMVWVDTEKDTDGEDRPIAFLTADWVDGNVHIEQVSVHPEFAGKRIGAGLIEHVAAWARERAAPALTLTTFAEVPWNAPYYERCGFRPMNPDEETPGLRKIRAAEIALGLDRWPRLCMRREL